MDCKISNTFQPTLRSGYLQLGHGTAQLVSYIVPAYNAGTFLHDTLESCFHQDYRPLEIVVVDDGSTDDTQAVVQRFQELHADQSFRIIYCAQENRGVNAARNRGLLASSGQVIGFLDADDLLPYGRTSLLCRFLREHDADVVYGPCKRFSQIDEAIPYLSDPTSPQEPTVERVSCDPAAKWVPNIWSFLMTRQFAMRVGPLCEDVRACWPDVHYTVNIRLAKPRMYRTSAIINLYRAVPGSLASKDRPEAIKDALISTRLIERSLREHGIQDEESWHWVGKQFRQVAWWAIRIGLKPEAAEALNCAALYDRGVVRLGSRLLACACRTTLTVRILSGAMRLRNIATVAVRASSARNGLRTRL